MSINPKLTEGKINPSLLDRSSTTYHEIIRYLEFEVEKLRKKNDDPNLTDLQTAALRGQIAENRDLLKKLQPKVDVSTDKMRA